METKDHSNWFRRLTPNQLVVAFLALWWVLNVVAGTLLELADDEAYYWLFSWHLDWGYFDHPPMVALLVKLGTWMGGELGIRFFSMLLQPLYLYLFWTLIRSPQASRREALLYCILCFAMPMLQLYGLLAVPDAPLLLFTVGFLWAYKRFVERDSWLNVFLLAASMALLMYSKYHGLLVIGFVLCSRWRNILSPKLYLSALLAILFYAPHLWWQYSHGFPSIRYHLVERHTVGITTEYLADTLVNLLVVFNPLFLFHYGRGLARQLRERRHPEYSWLIIGFLGFFTLSALRYSTQPQWMLPAVFAFIVILMDEARHSDRAYRYIRTAAIGTGILFLLVRLLILVVPLPGQLWNNEKSYKEIATLADGRPVVFMHNYTGSAKYTFYTGQPAYTLPIYFMRKSQWQYYDIDDDFVGQDVLVVLTDDGKADSTLTLTNGQFFRYKEVKDFHSLRKVEILPDYPLRKAGQDSVETLLHIYNPYPYPIHATDGDPLLLMLTFRVEKRIQPYVSIPITDTLAPGDTLTMPVRFPLPKALEKGNEYSYAFLLYNLKYLPSDNSPRYKYNNVE